MAIQVERALVANGGLVTGLPPHAVGAAESPDLQNIDPGYSLGARTRPGSSLYGASTTSAGSGVIGRGLRAWTRNNGTTYLFAGDNDGNVWSVDTGSWFNVANNFASGTIVQMAPLKDVLVVVGSGLAPRVSSAGSTLAALGGTPPSLAKYCTVYATKMWLAGDPNNPSKVNFSKSNDPEDWTTANNAGNIVIGDGDGDVIKGLEGTKRALYVFKRKNTYVVVGDTPFNFRVDLLCSWGLVSDYAHCSDGQGCFFAADDGIYYASGLNVARISDKVKDTYDSIPDKSKIAMELKGDKLFIFYPSSASSQNDTALVCAYKRKMADGSVSAAWSKYTSQPFGVATTGRDGTLYGLTNASTLQIYKLDTTDAAGDVSVYWSTPDMYWSDPMAPKTLMEYFVHMAPATATTTVTVRSYADGASAGADQTLTFGTSGLHDSQRAMGQAAVSGRFLRLRFSWTGSKTLYGWTAFADVRADGPPRR